MPKFPATRSIVQFEIPLIPKEIKIQNEFASTSCCCHSRAPISNPFPWRIFYRTTMGRVESLGLTKLDGHCDEDLAWESEASLGSIAHSKDLWHFMMPSADANNS